MSTLVMFSGGLDSTAMLVKLLEESADELRVHHVRMVNKERRDLAEQWIFPVYHAAKAELAAALPPELLDLTWSCRRPVEGFRPCLVCKACRARQGLHASAAPAHNLGT
jgi:7-cyano-7-deazaguanine synthase in queuosine biosynthesis